MGEEVDARDARDRVEGPVLVADERPRHRVEDHLAFVEGGGEAAEDLGGDG